MSDRIAFFNPDMADEYGVDIAIIYQFFIDCHRLTDKYPTTDHLKEYFTFWSKDHIYSLVSELYKLQLV